MVRTRKRLNISFMLAERKVQLSNLSSFMKESNYKMTQAGKSYHRLMSPKDVVQVNCGRHQMMMMRLIKILIRSLQLFSLTVEFSASNSMRTLKTQRIICDLILFLLRIMSLTPISATS